MTNDPAPSPVYRIRIEGHLPARFGRRFVGFAIRLEENGDTVLTGAVADQAALHALLRTVRDLGAPLVSLRRVDSDERPLGPPEIPCP